MSGTQVPFAEAIAALQRRLGTLLPSRGWTDTLGEVNNWGFAVAGAVKESLLRSIGEAVLQAEREGRDIAWFRTQFAAIVRREGWEPRGGIGWRARVILSTNLGQGREAGKWARVAEAVADGREVFIRYVATMDARTRPQHQAWHDTVLPPADPWWRTHAPKNGWGCRCTIQMMSRAGLERARLTPSAQAPASRMVERQVRTIEGPQTVRTPEGVDPGFGHSPGQRWADAFAARPAGQPFATIRYEPPKDAKGTPTPPADAPRILGLQSPRPPLPEPREAGADRLLPEGLTADEYASRFVAEFGAQLGGEAVTIADATGGTLTINQDFFINASGGNTADKSGRGRFLLLAADALRDPDEVWSYLDYRTGSLRLVRQFIAARQVLVEGRMRAAFVVFEHNGLAWDAGAWMPVTAYDLRGDKPTDGPARRVLESKRQGILIYRRPVG